MAGTAAVDLDRLAQDVLEIIQHVTAAFPRGRRRPGALKEGESLTLSLLEQRGTMVVGEIQRELNVLPAQMSRIIRSLENRDAPLVSCRINPEDKRKIDVTLTESGAQALRDYRLQRAGRVVEVLRELNEEHHDAIAAIIERVRDIIRQDERGQATSQSAVEGP